MPTATIGFANTPRGAQSVVRTRLRRPVTVITYRYQQTYFCAKFRVRYHDFTVFVIDYKKYSVVIRKR